MAARVKFSPRKVATPKELQERWDKKKNQIETLSENIGKLRRHVAEDLKSENEKDFLTALAIALIDKTGERVGNNASAENGNFGVTGLRQKHIKISGDEVTLSYRGKSGVMHETIFSSNKLATALKKAIKNSSGIRVFQTTDGFRIKNDKVNRYLEDFGISAKDIRGFRSNDWIIKGLSKNDIPDTDAARKKIFLNVLKKVAEKIGHGKSTLRTHYMIPELETSYINDGKIIDISDKETYEKGGKVNDKAIFEAFIKKYKLGKQSRVKFAGDDKFYYVNYITSSRMTVSVSDGSGKVLSDTKKIKDIVEVGGKVAVFGTGDNVTNDARKGGLLKGETDKGNGAGIITKTPSGDVFTGGGEIVINEIDAKENCELLSKINSKHGVEIPCNIEGNMSKKMEHGGVVESKMLYGGEIPTAPNIHNLRQAKELIKSHTAKNVWQKTGWIFSEHDNKWKFEIPDNNTYLNITLSELIDNFKHDRYVYKLSEVLNHSVFYFNYPDAKNTIFGIEDRPYQEKILQGESFISRHGKFTILLTINIKKYEIARSNIAGSKILLGQSKAIIIHECQHLLQDRHDFGRAIGIEEITKKLSRNIKEIRNRSISTDNKEEKRELLRLANEYEGNINNMAYEEYASQPAEIEAFNVSDRINFDDKERLGVMPVILKDNTFDKMDNGGKIMANKHSLAEFDELIQQLEVEAKKAVDNNDTIKLAKLNNLIGAVIDQKDAIYFNKGGKIDTLKGINKEVKEGNFILPKGHIPFLKVGNGGSSCSKCKFMVEKDARYTCSNKYYQEWEGTDKLPIEVDEYCSDWFEAKGVYSDKLLNMETMKDGGNVMPQKATLFERPDMENPVYVVSIDGIDRFIQRSEGMNPGDTAWYEVKKDKHDSWAPVDNYGNTASWLDLSYFYNIGYTKQEAVDTMIGKSIKMQCGGAIANTRLKLAEKMKNKSKNI